MSQQQPNIREDLNNADLNKISASLQEVALGDILALLTTRLAMSKIQTRRFTATGATQTVTFAELGMEPPLSLNYSVHVSSNTTTGRATQAAKTLTQMGLVGLTNAEVTDITVIEDTPLGAARVTVASNSGALAAIPAKVLDVIAVTGTGLGRKALVRGRAPAAGEVRWDGGTALVFNAADAVTSALAVVVPLAGFSASAFNRVVGQRDIV